MIRVSFLNHFANGFLYQVAKVPIIIFNSIKSPERHQTGNITSKSHRVKVSMLKEITFYEIELESIKTSHTSKRSNRSNLVTGKVKQIFIFPQNAVKQLKWT